MTEILSLKRQITKLLTERNNKKSQVKTLLAKLKSEQSLNNDLVKALKLNGIIPKLACSCFKDDCGCFWDSVKPKKKNYHVFKKSHYINLDFDGSDVEEIKGDILIGFKPEHLSIVVNEWKIAQALNK